jgi:hypothetical protein
MKPVRKIRTSNRSITGRRPSAKTSVSQQTESALERDYLTLLEHDESVSEYGVQPLTIHYINDGVAARYTPDVLVHYYPEFKRKSALVEVKYEAELIEKKDFFAARFKAASDYARQNGYEFRITTDKMIRTEYLWNVKFLSSYLTPPIEEQYELLVREQFKDNAKLTPLNLTKDGDDHTRGRLLYTIWQMLAAKKLACDLTQKITMQTILWINPIQRSSL